MCACVCISPKGQHNFDDLVIKKANKFSAHNRDDYVRFYRELNLKYTLIIWAIEHDEDDDDYDSNKIIEENKMKRCALFIFRILAVDVCFCISIFIYLFLSRSLLYSLLFTNIYTQYIHIS